VYDVDNNVFKKRKFEVEVLVFSTVVHLLQSPTNLAQASRATCYVIVENTAAIIMSPQS